MNAQNNNPSNRVAVVVVHGIADQRPGQTVRELARLLCHGSEGEPRYVKGELHEVLVPVEKLEPGSADDAASDAEVQGTGPPQSRDAQWLLPGAAAGEPATHAGGSHSGGGEGRARGP